MIVPPLYLLLALITVFWWVISSVKARNNSELNRTFKNKVVWVTGASSGVGHAIALELAKFGAHIILSGDFIEI